MQIGFKKVHPDAVLPKYAHEGDAGMDVCAVEYVELAPFTPTLVKTGLVASIPQGYEIQVRPRSGLALKQGITVWNSPGTVDSQYVGEIGVILLWSPSAELIMKNGAISPSWKLEDFGTKSINRGDRIAQLVIAPVTQCEPIEVTEIGETERGTGGFGSTGV